VEYVIIKDPEKAIKTANEVKRATYYIQKVIYNERIFCDTKF